MSTSVSHSQAPAIPFTLAGIRRGITRAQPLSLGVFAYGMAFGLIADQGGLSLGQAVLVSGVVYSGSAQLAALSILAAGANPVIATAWTLVATILVVNARYLLYSATLRPWLGGISPVRAYSTLFVLGDTNWLLSMRAHAAGERDAGFVFGSGVTMFLPWLIGTGLGYAASTLALDPRKLGLDFLMVGFAAAMMSGMARKRADLGVITIAAMVACGMIVIGVPNWSPVIAGLAGGILAFLRYSPEPGHHEHR